MSGPLNQVRCFEPDFNQSAYLNKKIAIYHSEEAVIETAIKILSDHKKIKFSVNEKYNSEKTDQHGNEHFLFSYGDVYSPNGKEDAHQLYVTWDFVRKLGAQAKQHFPDLTWKGHVVVVDEKSGVEFKAKTGMAFAVDPEHPRTFKLKAFCLKIEEKSKNDEVTNEEKEEISDENIKGKKPAEQIAATNPQQIRAIAKKIIATAMSRLSIDVKCQPVPGETYPDTTGERHQVYRNQYDRNSQFMKALLPKVMQQITEAFCNPNKFLANGLQFDILDSKGGLVWEITDYETQTKISKGVYKVITDLMLNSLAFKISLEIKTDDSGQSILRKNKTPSQSTEERAPLYFNIYSFINGAQVGQTGGHLISLQESAAKAIV